MQSWVHLLPSPGSQGPCHISELQEAVTWAVWLLQVLGERAWVLLGAPRNGRLAGNSGKEEAPDGARRGRCYLRKEARAQQGWRFEASAQPGVGTRWDTARGCQQMVSAVQSWSQSKHRKLPLGQKHMFSQMKQSEA